MTQQIDQLTQQCLMLEEAEKKAKEKEEEQGQLIVMLQKELREKSENSVDTMEMIPLLTGPLR